MPLRQMGEAVDLKAAVPNLKMRAGMQGYDQALRSRLQAVAGLSEPANNAAAEKALRAQQAAYQQRLAQLNETNNSGAGGLVSNGPTQARQGNYYSLFGGQKVPVTFGYGARYSRPHSGLTTHHGTDYGAKVGTAFYAPTGGTIEALLDTGNTGFGRNVRVRFDDGRYGIFGHLSSWMPNFKVGTRFTGGSQLGWTGNTGDSSGAHLHAEGRTNLYDPSTSFDLGSWFGW